MAGEWDVIAEQPVNGTGTVPRGTAVPGGWDVVAEAPAGPPKRDVGVLESAGRSAGERGAKYSRAVGLAMSTPAIAFDAVANVFRDKPSYGAQEWAFRNFVDPSQSAVDYWAIDPAKESQGLPAKLAGAAGGMAIDLPIMMATGGGSAIPRTAQTATEIIGPALASTARTMGLPAVVSGTDTAQRLQEQGVSVPTSTAAAMNSGLNTVAGGVLPLNAPGGVASRVAQGAISGPVQGQTERAIENAILTAGGYGNKTQPFLDPQEMLLQAVPAALMAGVMGPRPNARMPSRPDLGYVPVEPVPPSPEARARVEATIPPDAQPASAARQEQAGRVKERRAAMKDAFDQGVVYRRADLQDGELPPDARPVETARGTVPTGPEDLAALRQRDAVEAGARSPEVEQAFRIAQAQARRKQGAQDDAAVQGEPRDLREARAGGTTTPEGTAATQPQTFTFFRANVKNGQMVSGDRVEVVGEPFTTPSMKDQKGREVPLQVVRFLDRDGQPEMPVPVSDLTTMGRPANPRFAQDAAASSYAPPKGVGTGPDQPAPRAAGQRITTEPSPDFIPADRTGKPQDGAPAAGRQPQTYDAAEVNADRALARPREPAPVSRQIGEVEPPWMTQPKPSAQDAGPATSPPPSQQDAPAPRAEAEADIPPPPKPRSMLGRLRELGGVDVREIADITGEGRAGRGVKGIPPGLFRRNGTTLDDLATQLRDDGWDIDTSAPDGGVQQLRDMIRNELDGQRNLTMEDQARAFDYERALQQAEQAAEWQGLPKSDAPDVDMVARANEIDPDRVERAAIQYENDDAGFMAAIRGILDGDSNQARTTGETVGSRPDAEANPAAGEPAGRGQGEVGGEVRAPDQAARPDFGLEQPTEAGLRARADAEQRAAEDRARVENTPPPDDFTLTGSNRPADEAAARGQQDLLAPEPKRASGGTELFGGLPLNKMAEAVRDAFGWAGREASAWVESVGNFARAMGDGDIPRSAANFVRAVFDSSTGAVRAAVRRSGSKTAEWVIDQFAEKPGDLGAARGETFNSAWQAFTSQQVNRVTRALDGLSDAERAQVVAQVRNPQSIRKGTKIGDAAASIRTQLDETLRYLRDAGVDVGEVRNGYFPREYVLDRIFKDPEGFMRGAEQAYRETGLDAKKAAEAAKELHDSLVFGETGSVFTAEKGNTRAPFLKGRSFGKQVDDPKHPLNRFLQDDPVLALSRYFERASRRAEITRRFGDKWEKWAEIEKKIIAEGGGEELTRIKDYAILAAGLKAPGVSRGAMTAASWTRTWASLMFLEKATLSSLSEFIVPAIRAGNPLEIGRSLKTTVATLLKTGRSKELVALGEDLGIISHGLMDTMQAQRFAGGEAVSEAQRKVLDNFFRRTGLTQWTEATRAGSLDVGQVFLRRLAKDALEGGKLSASYLAELGVPKERAKAFAEWMARTNDGIPRVGDLKGPEGDLYRVAIRRFVKQSIMNPDATTKPAWMSHPLGAIVGQLQSFNYAFYENVWKRGGRLLGEAWKNDGGYSFAERARMAAPMAMMPLLAGAAFAIGEARDALLGDPNRRMDEEGIDKALKAASRGAPIAPIDPLLNWISAARYRRGAAESFAGPVIGKAARGLDAARDYAAKNADSTNTQERRVATELYDLVIEPTANLLLTAAPGTPLGKMVSVLGTQAAGAGGVREAFVEEVAGPRDPRTIPKDKRGGAYQLP